MLEVLRVSMCVGVVGIALVNCGQSQENDPQGSQDAPFYSTKGSLGVHDRSKKKEAERKVPRARSSRDGRPPPPYHGIVVKVATVVHCLLFDDVRTAAPRRMA